MTHVATIDEDLDVPHLKVTSTQHALGWVEGGANIGRVLKCGESIRDSCDGQKGALKGENGKNRQEYSEGSQLFLLLCRMGRSKTKVQWQVSDSCNAQGRGLGGLDLSSHHTSSSSTPT